MRFLSLTLDPETDTPEVLDDYAREAGTGPEWLFLTGKLEDIESIRFRLGIYDPDPVVDRDRTQHSGLVVLGNEPTRRWLALPALAPPERLHEVIIDLAHHTR